jgi:hypothetical protein
MGWTVRGSNSARVEIFRTRPGRPCGPPSHLYSGYRVFSGIKRPGSGVDHPPPSSAEVKERVVLYMYLWAFVACYSVTVPYLLLIRQYMYSVCTSNTVNPSCSESTYVTACHIVGVSYSGTETDCSDWTFVVYGIQSDKFRYSAYQKDRRQSFHAVSIPFFTAITGISCTGGVGRQQ